MVMVGSDSTRNRVRQLRMGLAGRQAQNELVSAQARSNLVNCPRQIPTCLVTSDVLDSIGNTPLIRLSSRVLAPVER